MIKIHKTHERSPQLFEWMIKSSNGSSDALSKWEQPFHFKDEMGPQF